jgi:hypothetical protein
MARKGQALERWRPEDVEALVRMEPGTTPGAGPREGQTPDAAETVLVLFDRGTPDDARTARVLAAVAGEHRDRVRAASVPAEPLLPRLQSWQERRRAYDTYDFRRWPAVGVFRGGRLITTFHPRRVFFDDRLQEREEREQLEIFLSKMVYYDPAQVKEQKNLGLQAEA